MRQIKPQRQFQNSDDSLNIDFNEAQALDVILKNNLIDPDTIRDLEKRALAGDESAKEIIRPLQEYLKKDNKYDGSFDGVAGNGTIKGINQLLKENGPALLKLADNEVKEIVDGNMALEKFINLSKQSLNQAFENEKLSLNEVSEALDLLEPAIFYSEKVSSDSSLTGDLKEIVSELQQAETSLKFYNGDNRQYEEKHTSTFTNVDFKKTKAFMMDL